MDRPVFYAKILYTKQTRNKVTASGCYANSLKHAKSVFKKMVERWDVDSFEIIEVSEKPFILKRYSCFVVINFTSGHSKNCELFIKEQTPRLAENLLKKNLMNSSKVMNFQVLQVEEVNDFKYNP